MGLPIKTLIIISFISMGVSKAHAQISPLTKNFFTSFLYFRANNPGVAAYFYEEFRQIYPNDSYTDLKEKIEGIEFNSITQTRVLYYFYRNAPNKGKLAYSFYFLCGYHDLADQMATYCYKKFVYPPKSVHDIKIEFDKIAQENREKQAQEAIDNAQRVTDADSINTKKSVDSMNVQLERLKGTKENLNLNEMLEFVKRKQFFVSDIKDYLLHVSSRKWNIEKFNNEIEISWNIDNSEAMDYNPQKRTLSIETSDDAFYNNIIKELNNGQYKRVIYNKHIPPEYYRALFQNKDYRIICSISRGGSMGNTNYEIIISQSQTAKN